ncbi:MAG: hypothetical protein NTY41_07420 [Proteobacteria bacterium]|nr:hypothetical protein [Pseudomonadota bacterium]
MKQRTRNLFSWRPFIVLTFFLPSLWASVMSSVAAEKYHVLTAAEIKATLVGQIATDGAHWSYYLKPDGGVNAISMGQKRKGHWVTRGNELCLTVPVNDQEECWTVVRRKDKLIFRWDWQDVSEVIVEAPSAAYQLE